MSFLQTALSTVVDNNQLELNNVLTGFLGVPGYIISTFFPSIQHLATKQPRLVKTLCVLIALTTFGFSLLDRIRRALLSLLVKYFMFSTRIDSSDPLYAYVLRWLEGRRKLLPEHELQARSKEELDRNRGSWAGAAPSSNDQASGESVVYDYHGLQIFWHQWRPYFVSPYPQDTLGSPDHLTVRCFSWSSQGLRDIINEAWHVHREKDQANLTAVYRPSEKSGGWRCVARRNRRSMDNIVLDPIVKQKLLEDVKFYLNGKAKDWYGARGIPYRRGYLFHGRPGTGKTSLSMAIAGQFELDIYIVSLLDRHIDDTFLHKFFTNLPKGALILLEDIDSAGLARETFERSLNHYNRGRYGRRAKTRSRVTLSGLLNAIDGADSPEGHLLIMTTNAPEALDEALVRPGRIDYKIGFKAISPPQARVIFMRMYKGDVDEKIDLDSLADRFTEQIPDDVFTPAELQGHLLKFKFQPVEALDSLEAWKNGILKERRELEEARQKEEDRMEKKAERRTARLEKRRARRRARQGSLASTDDDSVDSNYSSDSDSSYYSQWNGDPTYAEDNFI